ncbi:MAG: sigma-70 family RNA polymerase sigma factor [Lachnospiraceae bacterium]|jgi:DNA-directed RNA polymerase specialized sigma24 family protein|nr:sigma-70 family RNA polymerase sigma factor [Lachnospiraceae bacterium]
MDKQSLMGYQKLKREQALLLRRMKVLREKEVPVVMGKVKASSCDFPYIEHRLNVQMDEPVESDRIKRMLRIYRERQEKIGQQMLQIEEFIHGIEDAEIRQIFELRFIEGWKQEQIAKAIHLERSSVSKKISAYMAYSRHL